MDINTAYRLLYGGALLVFAVLIAVIFIRAVMGPRITDRIVAINMIGTMVVCSILILSRMLDEAYLADVALIYVMISFISVIILATTFLPEKTKDPFFDGAEPHSAVSELSHTTMEKTIEATAETTVEADKGGVR